MQKLQLESVAFEGGVQIQRLKSVHKDRNCKRDEENPRKRTHGSNNSTNRCLRDHVAKSHRCHGDNAEPPCIWNAGEILIIFDKIQEI